MTILASRGLSARALSIALVLAGSSFAAEPRVLIPTATEGGATWRYTTEKPDADWLRADFDDREWAQGRAGFGVTDFATPPAVVRTPWTSREIWLRKTFDVPGPVEFGKAGLIIKHDEDTEVWVNGVPVFSIGWYDTTWIAYDVTTKLRAALKPGKNRIAVHVTQTTGGQYIDVGIVLDPKQRLRIPVERLTEAERQELQDARWSRAKAQKWYADQPWPCGFNYVPANAISYTEMWMPYAFNEKLIDKELALAEGIGFNCLRVVLPFVVWEHDPAAFKKRLDAFLTICDRRGLKVMFTLFDDCAFGSDDKLKNPTYGRQPDVLEGWYANGWTPSPGHDMVRDPTTWPRIEAYVKDVIGAFKDDPRAWVWDLYNEPTNGGLGITSVPLVEKVIHWARQVEPSQPLTIAQWHGNEKLNRVIFAHSDIVTFHDYGSVERLKGHIATLRQHGRPIINTEWLNRGHGSLVATCLPIFAKEDVGCMHWGLVNGKTQTDLNWGHRPGQPDPPVWQHDLYRPDHSPYDPKELGLFRETIAARKGRGSSD